MLPPALAGIFASLSICLYSCAPSRLTSFSLGRGEIITEKNMNICSKSSQNFQHFQIVSMASTCKWSPFCENLAALVSLHGKRGRGVVNTCARVLTPRDSDLSGVLLAVGRAASSEGRAVDKIFIFKKKTLQPDWLESLQKVCILRAYWVSERRENPRAPLAHILLPK